MQNFQFRRAGKVDEVFADPQNRFLAGGTTLIDLMKLNVERPTRLVDVNHLPYKEIRKNADGAFVVGSLVTNSELARHPEIAKHYPALSQAILAGASAQLRNKATTGGNLLQRTRCLYFRDVSKPCNKREPGSGCSALEGHNRNLAVLGTSEQCIANNPSDMNVAMAAYEAVVHVKGAQGERDIPFADFHTLPGDHPEVESTLRPGEFITSVTLPAAPAGAKALYLKLRDRASYEFALASVAVVAKASGGRFSHLRLAMGGVGAKPWRCREAEELLLKNGASKEAFRQAAALTFKDAKGHGQNDFKIELGQRCLVAALHEVTA